MPFFRVIPHSLRALFRTPTFAATVVIVLALGVAANSTIFTLMDELLLDPFPYRNPGQLVMIWEANPAGGGLAGQRVAVAWSNFDAWRAQNHSFQAIEAYEILVSYDLTGASVPEHLTAARATPGFFPMMGINPAMGRTFLPGDDIPGGSSIVIVTSDFAEKHFLGQNAIGRTLLLNDAPYTVVGVLPKEFHLPAFFGGIAEYKADIWLPLARVSSSDPPQLARSRRLVVCGRLRPGVSLAEATADIKAISERRAVEDAALNQGYGINVFPLTVESIDPELRNELRALFLAAVVVLVLACVSLGGLMLVRAAARRRTIAVMAILGASRRALFTPILTESLILAVIAGALGFLLAFGGIHLVRILGPSDIHAPERLAINFPSFLFAACVSMLTVMIFGLVPAWIGSRANFSDAVRSHFPGRSSRSLALPVFVVLEIAATLSLAIAATLLIRSFQHVLAIDPGFQAQRVLTAHLTFPPQRYSSSQDRVRFNQQLQLKLQALPGVDTAALVDFMPLYAIRVTPFEIEGRPVPGINAAPFVDFADVSPGFLQAMDVPLREGRGFTDQDAETDPPSVVIINEALARQHWPNQNPLGAHIRRLFPNGPSGPWQTVVGVAGDFRQFNPETPARPELLWPTKNLPEITVVLRTKVPDPLSLSSGLKQAVWSIDPEEPVSDVQTLEHMVEKYDSQRRFNTLVLSAFAFVSVLLMLVGIYGLVSSFISSHRRDIGIRLALGARRRQVCLSLLAPTLPPMMAGIALGLLGCLLAKRVLAAVLFNVSPLDPATYVLVPFTLIGVLMVTSLSATLRAVRIDPAKVLRDE